MIYQGDGRESYIPRMTFGGPGLYVLRILKNQSVYSQKLLVK